MTVPEENRRKTTSTDEVVQDTDETASESPGGAGRTMREALEEADVKPDDFEE